MPPSLPEFAHTPSEISQIQRRLLRWFDRHGRDLPWRRTRDSYAILVSEFMLQQTQVTTVLPYYERWLARFPDFGSLARAKESEVLHAWQGLGYYARARNLHAAARFVRQTFGGHLPADVVEIRRLPGIGQYTAGAIATFAFDLPEAIVEANSGRVLTRLTNCREPIDTNSGRAKLWETARRLVPRKEARVYNSALIDLGALICLPRRPRCVACPIRMHCRAEDPASLPWKKARPRVVRQTELHFLARRRRDILLEQSRNRWVGMWILPRLAARPRTRPMLNAEFSFTHHRITLAVFSRTEKISATQNQRWFLIGALNQIPIPSPHRRALTHLLNDAG